MQQKQVKKELSYHILPTASTMIGVCVTMIMFLKTLNFQMKSYVDEILGFDTLVFIISCLLSYLSIRSTNKQRLEIIADKLFLIGLLILVGVGLLISDL